MSWLEPLAPLGDMENLEVDLVSFKASADVLWLQKALNLPYRWWLGKSSQLPLLQEIKDLTKAKTPSEGHGVLVSTAQTAVEPGAPESEGQDPAGAELPDPHALGPDWNSGGPA